MSLTATVLFNRPVTLPGGIVTRNDMDKPRRGPAQPVAVYRKKQAKGRAENLDRLVAAVAAGAMFVFHGPHRAVLITYPRYEELENILGEKI